MFEPSRAMGRIFISPEAEDIPALTSEPRTRTIKNRGAPIMLWPISGAK